MAAGVPLIGRPYSVSRRLWFSTESLVETLPLPVMSLRSPTLNISVVVMDTPHASVPPSVRWSVMDTVSERVTRFGETRRQLTGS